MRRFTRRVTVLCASVTLLLPASVSAATGTWTQLAPTGGPPAPRYSSGQAYDAANDRLILFSGEDNTPLPRPQDVWVLTNATGVGGPPAWMQLAPTGGPPLGRVLGTVVYAPGSNSIIVFGGCAANCSPALADVWVLSNANGLGGTPVWTQLSPAGAFARTGHSAAYDAGTNRMISFGGHLAFFFTDQNDVRVLVNADGTGGPPAWTQLVPIGPAPLPRSDAAVAYDQASNRLILFGGAPTTPSPTLFPPFNDVWVLTNANGLGGTPQWTQLTPTGGPPAPRGTQSADPTIQYDPATNQLFLFGGGDGTQSFNDVWVLSNANGLGGTPHWTQLTPTGGSPPARGGHSAGYSAATGRMVVAMGRNDAALPPLFNDVWVLELNQPPDCSSVTASPTTLWPPNHKFRLVTLSGATDPDGDPVTLTITGVTQDEPVSGLGSEDLSPDAQAGTQSNEVQLRSERSDSGDGRVYRIAFTGSDGQGGMCSGTATVGVPINQRPGSTPVDSAPPSYDSFGP